jgi:hypothetical protein
MFILVQFPVADLRTLVPGLVGRLPVPDWTADAPNARFVRGFGPLASRNSSAYGLVGERFFADFVQAARFRQRCVQYRQDGWRDELAISPWFRRFYFDGGISGRFEFGFLADEADERHAIGSSGVIVDPRELAGALAQTKLLIKAIGVPDAQTTLAQASKPLAYALLAATTRNDSLHRFPIAETEGRFVEVGPPTFHVRISNGHPMATPRDGELIQWDGRELFLTTVTGQERRRNVIAQESRGEAMQEGADERAIRVLFSHLNSLVFAMSKLLAAQRDGAGLGKEQAANAVAQLMERMTQFRPTGPSNLDDADFANAIIAFARSHVGRLDALTGKLEALAEDLSKPSTTQAAV